jgi:c-di-GMP-binding flagellar brake protein YcgR
MSDKTFAEKRVSVRRSADSEVSVFPENVVFQAKVVDISDTGMRIKTEAPQEIRIQLQEKGSLAEYEAQVVWVKVNDDGTLEYGLKYGLVKML